MTRQNFQPARKGNPGSGKIGGSKGGPEGAGGAPSFSLSLLLGKQRTSEGEALPVS
jgi:hypothetical protein